MTSLPLDILTIYNDVNDNVTSDNVTYQGCDEDAGAGGRHPSTRSDGP